jgi:hypothetical protein
MYPPSKLEPVRLHRISRCFFSRIARPLLQIVCCASLCLALTLSAAAAGVIGVSTTATNGSYKAGAVITITVAFDSAVVVGGIPQLRLETGVLDHSADYSVGSGSTKVVFTYTVQPGDTSARLDYASTKALELNKGVIIDSANRDADLTLPSPGSPGSLGANRAIVIDTTAPLMSIPVPIVVPNNFASAEGESQSAMLVTDVSARSYQARIAASHLTGLPVGSAITALGVRLNGGTAAVQSAPNTFPAYEVKLSQAIGPLASLSGAFSTNMSNPNTVYSNSLTLSTTSFPGGESPNRFGTLLDFTSPYIYQGGDLVVFIRYTVAPRLPLTLDATTIPASTAAGATLAAASTPDFEGVRGTVSTPFVVLQFVTSGGVDGTPDLDTTHDTGFSSSDNITSNSRPTLSGLAEANTSVELFRDGTFSLGATMADKDGRWSLRVPSAFPDGTYALTALATDGAGNVSAASKKLNITIDATPPSVLKVVGPAAGSYRGNQNLDFTVTYSENVLVDTTGGIPAVDLTIGSSVRTASYLSGGGSSALVFRYRLPEAPDESGPVSLGSLVRLNGGTISDLAGNNAALVIPSPNVSNVLVDTAAPTLVNVATPADGLYPAGKGLDFLVSFNKSVLVNTNGGTPTLGLTIGSASRNAVYFSGSGSNSLVFRHTVEAGDMDSDGIELKSPIVLSGGTINDAAGNIATLTFTNSIARGLLVDGIAPGIVSVNPPTNGTYLVNQNLNFTVNYTEPVNVNTNGGIPTLRMFAFLPPVLIFGQGLRPVPPVERLARYVSGNGSSVLVFCYTVQPGESLPVLTLDIGTASNGGTIADAAGNNEVPYFTPPNMSDVHVDGTGPSIASVIGPTNGIYRAAQNLDFTVNFITNALVNTSSGTPAIELTIGSTVRRANYVSGNDTRALLFRYVVATDESDTDGISLAPALILDGGTLKDRRGTNVVLNFIPPTTSGVLVDSMAPTVSISPPSETITRRGPVSYTVKYSDANFASSTLAPANVMVNATGSAQGSIAVTGSGAEWTVTMSNISGDGTMGISIAPGTATDLAGNSAAAAGPSLVFTVDNTAPNAPSIPFLAANNDTGRSDTDRITSATNLTFSGTAEIGSTVTLTSNSILLGTVVAADGKWSIQSPAMTSGTHAITATATDVAGNTSSASASLAVTVDTTAPTTSAILDQNITENSETGLLTFTVGDTQAAAAELVVSASSSNAILIPDANISLGGGGTNRTILLAPAPRQSGSAVITLSVTDVAGNTSSNKFTLTVKLASDVQGNVGVPPTTNNVVVVAKEAPKLGAIASQRILEDAGLQTVNLSGIGFGSAVGGLLKLSVRSSNPNLIATTEVSYTSPQSIGLLRYAPVSNGYGRATITVTVSDDTGSQSSQSFDVDVTPVNDAPKIDPIPDATLELGATNGTLSLTGISVGAPNEAQRLTFSATSDNPELLLNPQVFYSQGAAEGKIVLTPVPGRAGESMITLTAWDDGGADNGGRDTTVVRFKLTVGRSESAKLLYVRNSEGLLGYYQIQAEVLGNLTLLDPPIPANGGGRVRAVGDLNQDGQKDWLFEDDAGQMEVWLMNGNKRNSERFLNPSGTGDGNWQAAGLVDLDQDGQSDVMFQHTDGRLAVWLMNGLVLREARMLTPATSGDAAWRVVGNGDFNQDGKSDLLFQHNDGTLAVWIMDGTRLAQAALLNPGRPLDTAWRVKAVLDLNEDGKVDLVVQHLDGTIAALHLDALTVTDVKTIGSAQSSAGWRLVGP